MSNAAVDRRIEREYRGIVSDNLRWRQFTMRPGDIFVCTPPKCGTTWMQTIVATLIFPDGNLPAPVLELSTWIDARFEPIDKIVAGLDAQTNRRWIKTHTNADGIPWSGDSSYIVVGRDGRDAFMSFLNHMRSMRQDVLMALALSAADDRWPTLVERCTFAAMKQRSAEIADFDAVFVGGAESFLYKGTNGRWRDTLTADELAAFDKRCAELLPHDTAVWTAGRTVP